MAVSHTVSDTTTRPSGTGYSERIEIKLVDASFKEVAGYYDSGVMVGELDFLSDSDGTWSVNLVRNADISPANTYYWVKVGLFDPILINVTADGTLSTLKV